jgi:hypothetical protein
MRLKIPERMRDKGLTYMMIKMDIVKAKKKNKRKPV